MPPTQPFTALSRIFKGGHLIPTTSRLITQKHLLCRSSTATRSSSSSSIVCQSIATDLDNVSNSSSSSQAYNADNDFETSLPSTPITATTYTDDNNTTTTNTQYSTSPPTNKPEPTGAFQKIPMVAPSKEIWDSAIRKASRVAPNKKLKNEAARAKNHAARQLDTLMKELTTPLGFYERGFPPPKRLHPFETALLELTLGQGTYERVLNKVTNLRKGSVEVAKGYAARCSKATNKKEALLLQEEGFSRVEAVYAKNATAVDELKELAKSLRRLPVVDPDLPTVALVGAPNVGKSSLVQLLSSGLPEIQNYPFTTRSIKMGHFYVDSRRHQVTDTPGLLNRNDEDRNAMERLTLASLQYLPTAVLFVVDLTAECGTSVADQWQIRRYLKQRFANKPWIDVFSKADLLEEEFDAADEQQQQPSTTTTDSINTTDNEIPESIDNAIQFSVSIPHALRVSSMTGDGIDELKAAMLVMIEEGNLSGIDSGDSYNSNDSNNGELLIDYDDFESFGSNENDEEDE